MPGFTKQVLAETLKNMMQTQPIAKITVKDLVESCGVNRQTFYYHFQDIYELLAWVYENEALSHIEQYRSIDTWQKGISMIFEYIQNNKKFCLNSYKSMGREHLESFLHNTISKLLKDVINELEGSELISESDKKFIINFYTYALAGILLEWLQNGMQEDYHEIVNNIIQLMDGHLHQGVERFSMSHK